MDQLIRDMREVSGMILARHPNEEIGNPAVQLAVMAQKAADELEKRRWIPVEERLPEPGEKVLAFWEHESGTAVDFAYFMDGNMGEGWRYKNWVVPPDGITHWMALPVPPEEAKP